MSQEVLIKIRERGSPFVNSYSAQLAGVPRIGDHVSFDADYPDDVVTRVVWSTDGTVTVEVERTP